jgi:carboxymethylenebutenolidase
MTKAAPTQLLIERPASGVGHGVLVLHSWWGLTSSFRSYCQELAKHGFVAAASDLFGGRTATTIAEARRLRSLSRSEPIYKTLMRDIDTLRSVNPVIGRKVGVIGFSMGGHWAVWLSQRPNLPIASTVLYYAARGGDFSASHSAFLAHYAEQDEWVGKAAKQRMESAIHKASCALQTYTYPQTGHWFAESGRPGEYDAAAAQLALERTVGHLRATLGAPPG